MNSNDLKRSIKAGNILPVYFICGNEPYLIEHYTNLIIKHTVDALPEINTIKFECDYSLDDIYSNAFQVPMMSNKKCIIVSDLDIDKLNQKDIKLLLELAENPSDVAVVVFKYTGTEISFKKSYGAKKGKVQRDKFLDAVEKGGGGIFQINHLTNGEISKLLISGASKRNCTLDYKDALYMIERCSDDLTTLLNEIEKLCSFIKEGIITRKNIDDICTRSVSASIYDMSKAVLSNNATVSMQILNDLLYQKVQHMDIVYELSKTYIDIFRASMANKSGVKQSTVANDFNYGNRAFVLDNAFKKVSRVSDEQLRLSLTALCEADAMLKGNSKMKKDLILEQLIMRLILISSGSVLI